MGLERPVLERESFRVVQQQEATEVGGYRSRGLERPMLERELSGEAAGCSQRRVRSWMEEEGEEWDGRRGKEWDSV